MIQSDAERELTDKYPTGTRLTYMDPKDADPDAPENLVLADGVVSGGAMIANVSRQILDSEGNVTGHEPYALGYVPVWNGNDTVYVAVPNIIEAVKPGA